MKKLLKNQGFTLIELIIVIAIIALLAAATFVAVDPAKRIGEARDAQRWADITALVDAWQTYKADNAGTQATTTVDGRLYYIQHTNEAVVDDAPDSCLGTSTALQANSGINMFALVTAGYIGDIPDDPAGTDADGTDYWFYEDSTGKVIIGACEKYSGATNYPTVIR